MTFHKGHYSLIQYCPDPARMESVNVGVLLFCPEAGFLSALVSGDNRRVKQFFGRGEHDFKQLNLFKRGIKERISREAKQILSVEDLQKFIDRRANLIRITDPIAMRVSDPKADLAKLYDSLVGGEMEGKRTPQKQFRTLVAERLRGAHLGEKLCEAVPVDVPYLKKPVEFPFGFQNGRFNLILPVSFIAEDPDDAVRKAFSFAAEGEALHTHEDERFGKLKLIVVGEFRSKSDEARDPVSRLLERSHVRLIPEEGLDGLVQEIMATGKVIDRTSVRPSPPLLKP